MTQANPSDRSTRPTLVVPARFRGPASSGNGGWVAGALARHVRGAAAVRVRLSSPPPLDVPMDVALLDDAAIDSAAPDRDAAAVRLVHDGHVVAQASAATAGDAAPYADPDAFVTREDAARAAAHYPGAQDHPFPSCYVCSPVRADGLRLAPGRLPAGEAGRTATPWTPDASVDRGDGLVDEPTLWAALDCPGGWTFDVVGRPMVLGTMTAVLGRRPAVGEPCVVTGTARGTQGRKALSTTTLWSADGERLAHAAAVWILVDPASIVPVTPGA
jgi:hypothetical protein